MNIDRTDALFILEQLPDLVLLLDDVGCIRYANRRSIDILGDENVAVGKKFLDLVDERDLKRSPQRLEDWVDWRSYYHFPWELYIRCQDGRKQLVSGSAERLSPDSNSDSRLEGILVSLRLIGKPDTMNIRRNLLIAAIEAADSSIVLADMQLENNPLIYVNQGFLQLTGYEKSEIIGKNCRFLQFYGADSDRQDDSQPGIARIREALETGSSTEVILRNYRRDGSLFYNELYLTPVYEGDRLVAFIGVQNNITERIEAQQKLEERERILSSFFAATQALLGIVELPDNQPIHHVEINQRGREFFQVEEMVTNNITLASFNLPSEVEQQWQSAFRQCWETQEVVRFNCQVERSGEQRYLRVTINPIEIKPLEIPRCCYIAEDLTDLNTAEANLTLMKAAVENADESVIITKAELDENTNNPEIIYVNRAFTEITGYERKEAVGKTPRILQGNLSDPSVLKRLKKELIENRSFRGETINYRKDGQPFTIEWNIAPILDENNEVAYWVATLRDVTSRRQLEKEVLEVQAKEQERIARDLHDSIQQKLNIVGSLASFIKHSSSDKLSSQTQQLLQQLFETSKEANEQVRNIAHSLYPVNIEKSGLIIALQHLANTTQEIFQVECAFSFEQPVLISDRQRATHLYRIVQEAINNAIRHGKATQILIGLAKNYSGQFVLTVRDNGIGIAEKVLQAERGMGLNSMRYRAKIINADWNIERGTNGGTVVTCTFECVES